MASQQQSKHHHDHTTTQSPPTPPPQLKRPPPPPLTSPSPPPKHHDQREQTASPRSSNTNTYLEEDETQQQDTGSDAGLKWKHNLNCKYATAGDKEVSDAGVNNNQTPRKTPTTKHYELLMQSTRRSCCNLERMLEQLGPWPWPPNTVDTQHNP